MEYRQMDRTMPDRADAGCRETASPDALHEAEPSYRTVADFTYDWVYWETPDGTLRYVSPSCRRITGYSAEEFLADPDLLNELILRLGPNTVERLKPKSHARPSSASRLGTAGRAGSNMSASR
jgi:PAS domain-containing protein